MEGNNDVRGLCLSVLFPTNLSRHMHHPPPCKLTPHTPPTSLRTPGTP